jgi:hypothetical protein
MITKMVDIEDKDFKKPDWIADLTSYNHMPTPFEPMTFDEFIHKTSNYSPRFSEFRQIKLNETYHNVHIDYYYDMGIATVYPNKWTTKDDAICFIEPVKYFRIGCKHEFVELFQDECEKRDIYHAGRCYHVSECKLCKLIDAYDSSD